MAMSYFVGGNCQTAMIATITFEEENLGETLSTCRFAQRVACITNVVRFVIAQHAVITYITTAINQQVFHMKNNIAKLIVFS